MGIVDLAFYETVYIGEPIPVADFPRYEARAEQVIEMVCRGQYEDFIERLSPQAAEKITKAYKFAICAQMEYYLSNGLLVVTTGTQGEGFTVGKVSVSGGNSANAFATRGAAMLSPAAQMFLEQTGLLGRGVGVPVEPFAPFPWSVLC